MFDCQPELISLFLILPDWLHIKLSGELSDEMTNQMTTTVTNALTEVLSIFGQTAQVKSVAHFRF